jgi:CIC family chloride channel protein
MPIDARGFRQPNVPQRVADMPLTVWLAAVITGILAGLGAILMMTVLRTVQHLAFSYRAGEFSTAVAASSDARRLLMLGLGGLITGAGLWALHKVLGGTGGEPTEVVWTRSGHLSLSRTVVSSALSEVTVGMGGSIGREAAPQRVGAASGAFLSRRLGLTPEQNALLIACGAGAGLAAVYNTPLAGALFASELYLGTISLTLLLPAMITSGVATAVSWLVLPSQRVYQVPVLPHATVSMIAFALLLGPIVGLVSSLYVELIGWASDHRPRGLAVVAQPIAWFLVLGLLAFRYPLLLGNGVDLAQFAFTGSGSLALFAILALLKPLATAGTLRSGASGGLFTPTLSFGATLGALLGRLWAALGAGPVEPTYAVIAAAAMMAAAMEAPATAVVFVLELTHTIQGAMVPILLAVVGATVTARHIDARSIYSARLSPELPEASPRHLPPPPSSLSG